MAKSFKFSLLKLNAFASVCCFFSTCLPRFCSALLVLLVMLVVLFVFLFTKWKCLVEFGRCALYFFFDLLISISLAHFVRSFHSFSLAFCPRVSMFSVRKLFKCVLTKDLLVVLKGVLLFAVFSFFAGWRCVWMCELQTAGATTIAQIMLGCLALL